MKVEKFVEIVGADFFTGVPDSQLKALANWCLAGCPVVREIGTEMSELILDYFKLYGGDIPPVHGDYQVI